MAARFWLYPRYVLEINGKRIRFTSRCRFALALARLWTAQGRLVTHEELIEAAYYDDPDGGVLWADSCLKVAVCKMRRILKKAGVTIINVHGRGYRLILPQDQCTISGHVEMVHPPVRADGLRKHAEL